MKRSKLVYRDDNIIRRKSDGAACSIVYNGEKKLFYGKPRAVVFRDMDAGITYQPRSWLHNDTREDIIGALVLDTPEETELLYQKLKESLPQPIPKDPATFASFASEYFADAWVEYDWKWFGPAEWLRIITDHQPDQAHAAPPSESR